ncbi:ABC transporter substrate-binding protein [Azoarcus indigens]|uniref:Amino acid/amide ABC transporter substrate-binding protein (HAAT family) n=1 Tax=Azoarcus indigens TaxID=29545 RepID=A0A4R6DHG3_9RHOO|nr:ABC transporter substrate-binding protein [Azoarcus indigens]NMG67665.1 ABC transporter substrate-binding protein [Azoarcus indigens]TDN43508.1 amino acid/amide ABC transporter substrate-binding protein (HAAT family) [Azoarcus indigens]
MIDWKKSLATLVLCAAGTGAAIAQEPIKLGGLLETSGFIASLGQPALEGAQLAVEQVNAAGGINGRKVELVNLNTESDNTKTVSALRRLISQEKVVGIVGPSSSGSNFAIVDAVERAKVPMIGIGATRGIVLPPEQRRYSFLAPLTDVVVETVMLEDMRARGITRIAMLHSDVAFGTSARDTLLQLAGKHGITVVSTEVFGNADTDMTPQLTKIRGTEAQAVVIWATGPGLAISTKNYRALGLKQPLYLTHAANDFNYLRLAGEAANGALLPSSKIYVTAELPAGDAQKPVLEQFVKAYEAKYGKQPATFAGNGYDAAMLLMNAVRKAGDQPGAVRDALEQVNNYVGVTAVYAYGPEDHFGTKPESVQMLVVDEGKFKLAPKAAN